MQVGITAHVVAFIMCLFGKDVLVKNKINVFVSIQH